MGNQVVISGSGVSVPNHVISNTELCQAFNQWVAKENAERSPSEQLKESNAEFIEQASGIKQRYVLDKAGILDPARMMPLIEERNDEELSHQAEFAVQAARIALKDANVKAEDIEMIVLATSNLQRMYPAVAMEVQAALGASGFAFDISVGCSSGTFPIQIVKDALVSGSVKRALIVNPEIMCGHLNWRDRDSHFIFGDACTALVLETRDTATSENQWGILDSRLLSSFSSNIRNNGGYLSRCNPETRDASDKLFYQQGRKVFKDIVPLASNFIKEHIVDNGLEPSQINRYWLHQANINMNRLISKRILGREATDKEAPSILGNYGNTASCGSIICFNENSMDLNVGDKGVLCSFGAGYSIGSILIEKTN